MESPERKVVPKTVKRTIARIVKGLPCPSANDGLVITIVGRGFAGDLVAKGGRWRTVRHQFRVKIVPESEDE